MDKQGSSSKHENKMAHITIQPGARNIGGLVVIGASLAIAGLVGTFFVRKTKRRHFKKSESSLKGDEETKGVPSILQTSEPTCHQIQNRCCTSCESAKMVSIQMDSSELVSSKSLILEENLVPKINVINENSACDHQNILILDSTNSTPALGVLEDVCEGLKWSPLPELDTLSMAETNHKTESNSGELFSVKEDFEVKMDQKMESGSQDDSALKEDFEVETDHKMGSDSQEHYALDEDFENKTHQEEEESVAAEKESLEKTTSLHPLQEGELEDTDGDVNNDEGQEIRNKEYIIEKLEDGSEGTGSSSAESNSEAIWPAEFLAELSLAREDTMEDQQILEEKIVKADTTTKTNKRDHFNDGKCDILENIRDDCELMEDSELSGKGRISETMVVRDQVDNGVKSRIRIWSLLALMLCCYHYLPITTVCLTVLLIVVIYLYYDNV